MEVVAGSSMVAFYMDSTEVNDGSIQEVPERKWIRLWGTGMKPPNSPLRTKYPMIYVNLVDGSHQRP